MTGVEKRFRAKHFPVQITPTFLNPSHSPYPPAYKNGTDGVPKCRHIKFRRRGITRKKAYNIQNMAKVWNQNKKLVIQYSKLHDKLQDKLHDKLQDKLRNKLDDKLGDKLQDKLDVKLHDKLDVKLHD